MAKSSLLLLCCTLFACSVWAQNSRFLAYVPQKLEFKKANFGWAANANYFPAKTWDAPDDNTRSLMYTGSRKKKLVDMRLPEHKSKKVDFQMKVGPREPLFRRQ